MGLIGIARGSVDQRPFGRGVVLGPGSGVDVVVLPPHWMSGSEMSRTKSAATTFFIRMYPSNFDQFQKHALKISKNKQCFELSVSQIRPTHRMKQMDHLDARVWFGKAESRVRYRRCPPN